MYTHIRRNVSSHDCTCRSQLGGIAEQVLTNLRELLLMLPVCHCMHVIRVV